MTFLKSDDTSTPAARAVRRELDARVKNDWEFPSLATFQSRINHPSAYTSSHTSAAKPYPQRHPSPAKEPQWVADNYRRETDDVVEWRERTYASSDPSSGSEGKWASEDDEGPPTAIPEDMASISKPHAPKSKSPGPRSRHTSPSKSPSTLRRKRRPSALHLGRRTSSASSITTRNAVKAKRNRRRRARLDAEMTWNEGLAHWAAQRDAWCCAVLVPEKSLPVTSPETAIAVHASTEHKAEESVQRDRHEARQSSVTLASSSGTTTSEQRHSADGSSGREDPAPGTPPTEDSISEVQSAHEMPKAYAYDKVPAAVVNSAVANFSRPFAGAQAESPDDEPASAANVPVTTTTEASTLLTHHEDPTTTTTATAPSASTQTQPQPSHQTSTSLLPIPPSLSSTLPPLTPFKPTKSPINLHITSILSPPPPSSPRKTPTSTTTPTIPTPTSPTPPIITATLYPTLYRKIVLQSLRPAFPINLAHMINALVQGWVEDGEWPLSAAPAHIAQNIQACRENAAGYREVVSAEAVGGKKALALAQDEDKRAKRKKEKRGASVLMQDLGLPLLKSPGRPPPPPASFSATTSASAGAAAQVEASPALPAAHSKAKAKHKKSKSSTVSTASTASTGSNSNGSSRGAGFMGRMLGLGKARKMGLDGEGVAL